MVSGQTARLGSTGQLQLAGDLSGKQVLGRLRFARPVPGRDKDRSSWIPATGGARGPQCS